VLTKVDFKTANTVRPVLKQKAQAPKFEGLKQQSSNNNVSFGSGLLVLGGIFALGLAAIGFLGGSGDLTTSVPRTPMPTSKPPKQESDSDDSKENEIKKAAP